MRKIILLLLLVGSFSVQGNNVLIDRSDLNEASAKTLVVITDLKNDYIHKFIPENKKKSFEEYYENYDSVMRSTLSGLWTLTQGDIKFLTTKEAFAIPRNEYRKYLFLHAGWHVVEDNASFRFRLTYENEKGVDVVIIDMYQLPFGKFSSADVIFFSKYLNNEVEISRKYHNFKSSHNIDSCINVMKNKTLLLDQETCKIPSDKLADAWPYKVEVVSPERIQKEIESASDQYMFIKLLTPPGMYVLFDTKSCTILGEDGVGGVTVQIGHKENFDIVRDFTVYKSNYGIKEAHIKYFTSKFAQKLNCK